MNGRLLRWWPFVLILAVAGATGWSMLPINADMYTTHVYSDPQGADQQTGAYRFDALSVYTSGLGWCQLLAIFSGILLVLLDPPTNTAGTYLRTRAARAAAYAVCLAAADLAIVLPRASAHLADHWVLAELRGHGEAIEPVTLASASVWLVLSGAILCVALSAVIGVAIAVWFGRWWKIPTAYLAMLTVGGLVRLADEQSWLPGTPDAVRDLAHLLTIVALPWWILWYMLVTPAMAPFGVMLTVGTAMFTLFAARSALRNRLIRTHPDANHSTQGQA